MIEISFGKLILLALVALIVLGPEKLPGAARTAGALVRRLRSGWDNVRAEVERELEIEEIRRAARAAAAHADAAQAELDNALRQVREPFSQAVAKTRESFALTDATATAEPSSSSTQGVLMSSQERAHGDAGRTVQEQEQEQGKGLPLTPTVSPENSIGGEGARRSEPGSPMADSRLPTADPHATGQLFGVAPSIPASDDGAPSAPLSGAAPATIEPEPAAVSEPTRNSAHGGH